MSTLSVPCNEEVPVDACKAGGGVLRALAGLTHDATARQMATNFAAIFGALALLSLALERRPSGCAGRWLADAARRPAKRACELWFLQYGAFWIACFGVIIGFKLYEVRVHHIRSYHIASDSGVIENEIRRTVRSGS